MAISTLSGNETVLVVEDQEAVRTYTAVVLRGYGYRVMEAAGPVEALMICAQCKSRIHLVLTDVAMPHASGPELVRELHEIRPDIKVVFMSGYTDEVILRGGLPESSGFIMKPFGPEELAAKVREVLGPQTRAMRVLVADDEAGVRAYLREVLESDRYEVTEAADGKQAMRRALAEQVDLVITDLVMPGQEGIETIQALRREAPDIRIIATSGAFSGRFLGMAKMLGADAALSKPFSPEALLAKVTEVMASRPCANAERGVWIG
jgi:CheY-like chemotaxis protein